MTVNMNIEYIIHQNITILENKTKQQRVGGNRNVLNKWFQDTVKAYIMERVAAPLLIKHLKVSSTKEVRKHINVTLSKELPAYISIILKYFELIVQYGEETQFKRNLKKVINSFDDLLSQNCEVQYNISKKIRASFVSLLIYNFFMEYLRNGNIDGYSSFFQIWTLSFPEQLIIQRRRNFRQMIDEDLRGSPMNSSSSQIIYETIVNDDISTNNGESTQLMNSSQSEQMIQSNDLDNNTHFNNNDENNKITENNRNSVDLVDVVDDLQYGYADNNKNINNQNEQINNAYYYSDNQIQGQEANITDYNMILGLYEGDLSYSENYLFVQQPQQEQDEIFYQGADRLYYRESLYTNEQIQSANNNQQNFNYYNNNEYEFNEDLFEFYPENYQL